MTATPVRCQGKAAARCRLDTKAPRQLELNWHASICQSKGHTHGLAPGGGCVLHAGTSTPPAALCITIAAGAADLIWACERRLAPGVAVFNNTGLCASWRGDCAPDPGRPNAPPPSPHGRGPPGMQLPYPARRRARELGGPACANFPPRPAQPLRRHCAVYSRHVHICTWRYAGRIWGWSRLQCGTAPGQSKYAQKFQAPCASAAAPGPYTGHLHCRSHQLNGCRCCILPSALPWPAEKEKILSEEGRKQEHSKTQRRRGVSGNSGAGAA